MRLMRAFWQWFCPHQGKTLTVPIVGRRPDEPETDDTFCCDCGKRLSRSYRDSAGTEIREVA